MLGNYFYHEIIRKTIVSFGTLFNQIYIKHMDKSDETTYSTIKVPLAYGPSQKFLVRIEQQAELNRPVQITLPRMSFEMNSIQYDSSRKLSVTQAFKAVDDKNKVQKVYMPVPYNIGFELNILTKLNDDALQIIEQILPFFQPSFNLTIDLVESIGEKRDIPIVLENISFQDDYEGDFLTRRALIYTLQFTAKTYLFGHIADNTEGLIKKVQVDYSSSTNLNNAKREIRYIVTPVAKKDYNNDNSSVLIEELNIKDVVLNVNDTSVLSVGNRIIIDNEIMKITSLTPDTIKVIRGYDNTIATEHVSGSSIDVLSESDNKLIAPDDDFGFNEETFFLQDSGDYSNTRKFDLL